MDHTFTGGKCVPVVSWRLPMVTMAPDPHTNSVTVGAAPAKIITKPVTHSNALTPAQKQKAYRDRNGEKVRTANAERMRQKRAKAG